MLLWCGRGVLAVVAVAVLGGCDHRGHRMHYGAYANDVVAYTPPPVVVRGAPVRRPVIVAQPRGRPPVHAPYDRRPGPSGHRPRRH
jgi:hypothetical protein